MEQSASVDQYVYVSADNVPVRVQVTGTAPLSQTDRAIGLQLIGSPTITWYTAAAWASGTDADYTRDIEIKYGPSGIGALSTGIYVLWARVGAAAAACITAVGPGPDFSRLVVFAA